MTNLPTVFKATAFCLLNLSSLHLYTADFPQKALLPATPRHTFEALTPQQQHDAELLALGALLGRQGIGDMETTLQQLAMEATPGTPSSKLVLSSDSALLNFLRSDLGFCDLVFSLEKKVADEVKKHKASQDAAQAAEKKAALITASKKNLDDQLIRTLGVDIHSLNELDTMEQDKVEVFFKNLLEKRIQSISIGKFIESSVSLLDAFEKHIKLIATAEEYEEFGKSLYTLMALTCYPQNHTTEERLAFIETEQ